MKICFWPLCFWALAWSSKYQKTSKYWMIERVNLYKKRLFHQGKMNENYVGQKKI